MWQMLVYSAFMAMLHGGAAKFGVDRLALSKRDISRMLKPIPSWAYVSKDVGDDLIMSFCVPNDRAKQAYAIMDQERVRILSCPPGVGWRPPTRNPIDKVMDWLTF